jgi:tRNA uridine 5-carbamoylmethylation protein Kti12
MHLFHEKKAEHVSTKHWNLICVTNNARMLTETKTKAESTNDRDREEQEEEDRCFDLDELSNALKASESVNDRFKNQLVLCLCGLPGSGKSSVAKKIKKRAYLEGLECHLLSMDEFERRRIDEGRTGSVDRDDYEETKGRRFGPESWKRAREDCFERLREVLSEDEMRNGIVIIDDTMHYKSMRRECYRYAREFRAAFVVLFVDTEAEVCWERNSARSDEDVLKVPRDVFERLETVFDKPGAREYDADDAYDKNYLYMTALLDDDDEGDDESFIEKLLEQIYERWINDETPRRKDELELLALKRHRSATDRVITAANLVHDVDVQTRKLLSEFMQQTTSSSSSTAHKDNETLSKIQKIRSECVQLARDETKFDARKDQLIKERGDLDSWFSDATSEKYCDIFREKLLALSSPERE